MRTECKTIEYFQFDELSDNAKERAREWFRSGDDGFWSECATESIKENLVKLGFNKPTLYWSGFSSQGDGACIVGSWYASDCKPDSIISEYPADNAWHKIAVQYAEFIGSNPSASASLVHRGHYYHEISVEITADVPLPEYDDEQERTVAEWRDIDAKRDAAIDELCELFRDVMRECYRTLNDEYEYANSDECVDGTIRANDYEFDASGARI